MIRLQVDKIVVELNSTCCNTFIYIYIYTARRVKDSRASHKYYKRLHGIRAISLIFFFSSLLLSLLSITMSDSLTTNLVTINVTAQAPLKLNSSNYLSWKLQFQTLFVGYDLHGYIDGTKPCPTEHYPTSHTNVTTDHCNPEFITWRRQDQLILNAIIGSLTPAIILIST